MLISMFRNELNQSTIQIKRQDKMVLKSSQIKLYLATVSKYKSMKDQVYEKISSEYSQASYLFNLDFCMIVYEIEMPLPRLIDWDLSVKHEEKRSIIGHDFSYTTSILRENRTTIIISYGNEHRSIHSINILGQ